MYGRRKREIPEKTLRPTASCGTIPTCENPGIERGSLRLGLHTSAGIPGKLQASESPASTTAETQVQLVAVSNHHRPAGPRDTGHRYSQGSPSNFLDLIELSVHEAEEYPSRASEKCDVAVNGLHFSIGCCHSAFTCVGDTWMTPAVAGTPPSFIRWSCTTIMNMPMAMIILPMVKEYTMCIQADLKQDLGSIPSRVSGFSRVGIVPDYAVCRRVFSGISRFPPPFHSGAAPFSPQCPSSVLKTSLLRAAQISSLALFTQAGLKKTARFTRVNSGQLNDPLECGTLMLPELSDTASLWSALSCLLMARRYFNSISYLTNSVLNRACGLLQGQRRRNHGVIAECNGSGRIRRRFQPSSGPGAPLERRDTARACQLGADVPIPAFAWSDFGKPWKAEIKMVGPGIESGSSRARVQMTSVRQQTVTTVQANSAGVPAALDNSLGEHSLAHLPSLGTGKSRVSND
ncbi:hypothetical protein PR048_029576, partial [Dryococelus australis]